MDSDLLATIHGNLLIQIQTKCIITQWDRYLNIKILPCFHNEEEWYYVN